MEDGNILTDGRAYLMDPDHFGETTIGDYPHVDFVVKLIFDMHGYLLHLKHTFITPQVTL